MPIHSRLSRLLAVALAAGLTAGAAQAQFKERNFRVSNGVSKEHPMGNGLAKMGACTLEKSGGKMKIQPFWDGALGSDLTGTQSVRTGSLDMVITSTAPVVSIVPALGVFDLPFLFNTSSEADKLLDGKVGDWFSAKLPAVGLVNLAWWENGFRHTTNSKRPINKVEDFDGVKMRVMQNAIFLDTFKTLGSNAVPMAFTEVYSALETKTVDGQENPFTNIENMKFYEVQKYLTLTKHAYSPTLVLFSKKIWDTLSAQEQATLRECAVQGRDEQRRANRAMEARSVDSLKAKGMTVNEIAPAEMQRIRERSSVIYERHAKAIGDQAITMVTAELKRIRDNAGDGTKQ
ncbi:putative TRAP dicarboxylate transporter, C4-dicarboxylate-binding protein DctP [Variovorax paradoxus B4]|uniref:Putative TRAP dicarboxylate transporter, C4-dicarboxylate-binding protein DctP n=1 Tax=Variovorax paradoxus B4 TaxID=1246301 RepID=T1XDZ3_VARPD|nr:TRAP transporter substrate-binding protein [Variovorax paradoxus]AGU51137.1 putative TRAP dicarboxylate transporter, C4-dicarboxylate-binding protein DctP [Variovorax paradoxus B4]